MPIVNNTYCESFYKDSKTPVDALIQFCAGGQVVEHDSFTAQFFTLSDGGQDSCGGDSGGPMLTRDSRGIYYQAGIVSFGPRRCGVRQPAVYTRLSAFIDWIRANLEP